jgi:hypothetical protein
MPETSCPWLAGSDVKTSIANKKLRSLVTLFIDFISPGNVVVSARYKMLARDVLHQRREGE